MLKIVPEVQDSIARYDIRDTGICAQGPFAVSQCCPNLNTFFLLSSSCQKSMSLNQDKKISEMTKITFPFTDSTIGAVDRLPPPPPALSPLPDLGDLDVDEILFDNEEKIISSDLDTSYLPSQPSIMPDMIPLVKSSLEKILSDKRIEEQSKPKRSKTKKGKKIPNFETQDSKNGKER